MIVTVLHTAQISLLLFVLKPSTSTVSCSQIHTVVPDWGDKIDSGI
jgi:hypothetical protein